MIEFLCAMYGLSGASVRHPCLWWEISSDMLKVKLLDRVEKYPLRTLEALDKNLYTFKNNSNSNLKKAKFCFNGIGNRFFNIPLSQVCIPGLHITLGVVVKFVKMFELFAIGVDFKIGLNKAMINNNSITIGDVNKNVDTY